MKWSILLNVGIILFSASGARAQQPDTALLFLHYKFSHVRDTSDRASPYKEDMVLAIGKNASVYRSYDRQRWIAQTKKEYRTAAAAAAGGPITFNIHVAGTGTEYYQFPNTRQLVRKEELFGSFLVTSPLPVIAWQVTGDTSTLGGLPCQKATGHFKGRDYIAWFCPDLPLHTGPWELSGLPGVIVEAYDIKRDVQFLFDGIEKAGAVASNDDPDNTPGNPGPPPIPGIDYNGGPNLIKLPENATKTTDKEFAKLQAAFRKDPNAFAQSMMAAHSSGMAGDNGPKMKMDLKAGPAGPVINNPIELPEKQ